MTFTGTIGNICMFPLRAIIRASVALGISPNTLTLIFATMTSYARARAECLVDKCKVGFMERPERIVLFMIGAFTNRMAAVLWVILALSILAVANRIYFTFLALNRRPMP